MGRRYWNAQQVGTPEEDQVGKAEGEAEDMAPSGDKKKSINKDATQLDCYNNSLYRKPADESSIDNGDQ